MIGWFRTTRRLRSEVAYLQGRLNAAAAEQRALVVRPGPLPGAAPVPVPAVRTDTADALQGRITALEKLKTTAGALQLTREVRVWRERAANFEEQLLALQVANEAADVNLERVTGQLAAATAQLTKLGWHAERSVGLS
ncbi:hypothetical protein [Streptomyces sp. TBY4]|uniref:hypothetical protein n=1 Tax=Streptomyces sp. TBY4 TaxID=2962030 RepID=UPI0020B82A51|nr:hypothetical protein [Streptomyces sp. TBY4]MCP3758180.1 hypothetical protein [Streptomyces sp. TBY4]